MTVQDRPRWSRDPAQRPVVAGDERRYTNMYETRNETNRSPQSPLAGDRSERPGFPPSQRKSNQGATLEEAGRI
jgi:hypothetical protein